MTKKPPAKGLFEPEVEFRSDGQGLTEAEWDAWGERNKEALQASFDQARKDHARGRTYTLDEVMNRVRSTIDRVAKKG